MTKKPTTVQVAVRLSTMKKTQTAKLAIKDPEMTNVNKRESNGILYARND